MPSKQDDVKKYTSRTAQEATEKHWVGQLARWGYLAIGIVYILVGLLAVLGLVGMGGSYTGSGGAARTILSQAFLDVENRGRGTSGLARRFGLLLSGLSYSGVAVAALRQLFIGGGSVSTSKGGRTATLMSYPAGSVLVALVGLGVIGTGLFQFYAAYQGNHLAPLDTERLRDRTVRWLKGLGILGLSARGIVFCLIGWFFILAAWRSSPDQARGLGGTLQYLGRQPYGRWLIGIVAAGLFAYGVYMLAKVPYRQISPRLEDGA